MSSQLSWIEVSEMVAGCVLEGRISLNSVRPELFHGTQRDLIKYMKAGITEPEDLIKKAGLETFQSAVEASKHLNGAGDMADWVRMLEESAVAYEAGVQLQKIGRSMQLGESPNWTGAKEIITKGEGNISTGYVPLSTIESGEVKFIKSGWPPFDTHVGGFPEAGLIVEGGNPGVGKTTSMIKFASCFAKEHPDKVVAVSSIEMLLMEVSGRFREIAKLPKDVEDRILIDDTPVTAEQAINNASRIDNLGLLIIDFADLMIRGETTESSMAHIYRTLMIGAKQLHIPIILLSQLSYKYQGGLPHPDHLRYTSLAKALAWMIIMLYNPSSDFYEEDSGVADMLPIVEDKAYMILWKVRGGFRKHINDSPGAIQIAFRGDKGWGDKTSERSWYSLKKYS